MRILLVDDEVALTEPLAEGLQDEGFAVDVVHDGREAVWLASEGNFAVIVLDVLLPGLNGFAVCRQLRARGVRTPVLMLTVRNGVEDETDALDLGADDFLTKPFAFEVLLARLRALLRRGRSDTPTPLRASDLELDVHRRACRRRGVDIPLSAREFTLLHALMERPGEVVGRAELRKRVWGWDFDGNPGILDVYIGYLRSKLDRPFALDTIETVRGVGYRIQASA